MKNYSKGARGLSVYLHISRICTGISISQSQRRRQ